MREENDLVDMLQQLATRRWWTVTDPTLPPELTPESAGALDLRGWIECVVNIWGIAQWFSPLLSRPPRDDLFARWEHILNKTDVRIWGSPNAPLRQIGIRVTEAAHRYLAARSAEARAR